MLEGFDLNAIHNLDQAREAITGLLNLVEEVAAENRALRDEVQRLRDENHRLQGEQGKPSIKPDRKSSLVATVYLAEVCYKRVVIAQQELIRSDL